MGFVLPDRKRPSYWVLARSLGRGMCYSTPLTAVVVSIITMGLRLPTFVFWLLVLVVAIPIAGFFGRHILSDRVGYDMPWPLVAIWATVGHIATPWGGAWLVREILRGSFGGEEMQIGPAPGTQAPLQPLAFQTGLQYVPPPLEVVVPQHFLEPEAPAELPALRIVAPRPEPEVVEPAPVASAKPAVLVREEPAHAPVLELVPETDSLPALELDLHEPEPDPAPELATSPVRTQIPIVVTQREAELPALELEEEPFFLPHTDLEPAAAHDPFATFWLDPSAPTPEGLTPGYLPPLTPLWKMPTGDKL